jgi:hypothetical protein
LHLISGSQFPFKETLFEIPVSSIIAPRSRRRQGIILQNFSQICCAFCPRGKMPPFRFGPQTGVSVSRPVILRVPFSPFSYDFSHF